MKKDEGQALIREFNILKAMDHPNIIRLYELFEDDHNFYIVTEYCKGGDILDLIQRSSNFCEYNALKIMSEIISAVNYCHKNNIVHRDIKSENVMFTENDLDSPVKLIDFGISLKFQKDIKIKDKTGTILYVAPEVLKGSYDEKCDVWSCGVLLYLILSGYPPFYGQSRNEVMMRIMHKEPKFDAKIWTRISPEAINLIKKMLTKDPEKRPSSEEVMQHDWFKNKIYNDHSSHLATKTYLANIRKFSASTKLGQAIMTFIVSNLSAKEVNEEIMMVFKGLDSNNDGRITHDELISGFETVYKYKDKSYIETEVNAIMEDMDSNVSGYIDYTEFLVGCMNREKVLSRGMIDLAFKEFDLNNDGFIDKEEFETLIEGISFDDFTWGQFLVDCDTDKDGKVRKPLGS